MRRFVSLCLSMLVLLAAALPAEAAQTQAVQGVVTDHLGRPVARAELEVYQLGVGLVALLSTDRSGAFTLSPRPAQGAFVQMRASAPGYRALETGWIDLSRRAYFALEMEQLTGEAMVSLYDTEGQPVAGQALLLGLAGELVAEVFGSALQRSLPAGDYRVVALAPTRAPRAVKLTVAAGRTTSAVVALASAQAVLSGEVRDALTGAPLGGARVELLTEGEARLGWGLTDTQGRFRLPAEPAAGTLYRLQVAKAGYRSALTAPTDLAPGQQRMWSGNAAIALQPLTGAITGALLNSGGQTLAGVRLALHLQGYGQVAETTAGAYGEFGFTDLAAGADRLYRVTTESGPDLAQSPWTPLTADSTNQIVLQSGASFWTGMGTASAGGVVRTPAGQPVGGAKVEILRRNEAIRRTETAADGSFLIKEVTGTALAYYASEPYSLRVSRDGFAATREFVAGGRALTDLSLLANSRTMVTVSLHPTAFDLQGRVTGQGGRPLAGARVRLASGDQRNLWKAETDAGGWYTLAMVPSHAPSGYSLEVEAEGYRAVSSLEVTGAAAGGAPLPTVALAPAFATFRGQVVGPGGAPLEGVTVTLRGPDGTEAARAPTLADGTYRFTAPAGRPGLHLLEAAMAGRSRAVAELGAPAAGAEVVQDLVLLPEGGDVVGRVVTEAGQAVAGAEVELLEEGAGIVAKVTAGPDGRYAFEAVVPSRSGWFWLRVRSPAGRTFAGSLRHGTELVPLLRLVRGETISVDLLVR